MPEPKAIIWLLKAEIDFQETYNRISRFSEDRAERFYDSVNRALDHVAEFPESGRTYALPIRRVLALGGRYGVFYREEGQRVVVLGVEDLRQDPGRIRRNLGLDD